jgi:Ca2+-binding RTX toxin-like protein
VDVYEFTVPDNFECVIGSGTRSSVTGNDEDNIFLGGAGDDIFAGMGGADTVLITSSMGHDEFLDFNELEGDRILFAESPLEFSYSESELGFIISIDSDNSLTVTYA